MGIQPFKEAKATDFWYKMITDANFEQYWEKISKHNPNISDEFKDLAFRMLSCDPSERPPLEELRSHPWMQE